MIPFVRIYNAFEMIGKNVFLGITLILLVTAIDQICSEGGNSCPQNADCEDNDYCVCESGFIGNCNIPAKQLTSSPTSATLTSGQTSLFYVVPSELGKYIEFEFIICQNNTQLSITLTLWGESGLNTQYNSGNALTAPLQTTIGSGCTDVTTPYVEFGTQPNGQAEMLILGITDNSSIPANINISVDQHVVVAFLVYYYLLIALGSFIVLFLIIGGAIFVLRRRRLRTMAAMAAVGQNLQRPEVNDISYFQTEMPIFKAFALGNERNACPICLMQIEKNDLIRKTPCAHSFHSNCIDSWCLKNLNCPVCRADLSREKINLKKDEPVAPEYHPVVEEQPDLPEEKLEERPAQGDELVSDKYAIRESML